MMTKKRFTVEAEEVVYYTFYVEAESIEEAEAMVKRGDYDTGDPIDGDFFEVTGIYETIEEKHE